MSETTFPPRYETRAALDNLDRLLHLDKEGGTAQQDWQLVIADPRRLPEFCDLYENGWLDTDTKFALMMLIVASLDEALEGEFTAGDAIQATRIEHLLRRNFFLHLHTIHYWSNLDEADPDNVFPVTPRLRRIWADCFKPEYQQEIE